MPSAPLNAIPTPAMHITLPPRLDCTVALPTSKSVSARALIIHALADAPCPLEGLSDCDDTRAMLQALTRGGEVIDVGAAGTAMRFLTAFLATREGEEHVLTGSERMQQRPIGILVDALRQLGADIRYEGREGYPPLRIRGRRLEGGTVTVKADVSSQYISALMMIAPTLRQGLSLRLMGTIASRPYIHMTQRLMLAFGVDTEFQGQTIAIAPSRYVRKVPYSVEPDWSAASYWYELVALTPDPAARVVLPGLQEFSLQGDSICARYFSYLGVTTTFSADGAVLTKTPSAPDPATVFTHARPLEIDFSDCPDLAQTFVVSAALMDCPFRFDGLHSLRIKETDRIAALISELAKMGIAITETAPGQLSHLPAIAPQSSASGEGLSIATYDDHRMAMAFAPAAYRFPGLSIEHPEVVSKSYPNFWTDLPLR